MKNYMMCGWVYIFLYLRRECVSERLHLVVLAQRHLQHPLLQRDTLSHRARLVTLVKLLHKNQILFNN